MFSRLMAKTIPCIRFFKVGSSVSLEAIKQTSDIKSIVHEDVSEKALQGITDSLFLGSIPIPNYTMGDYSEQMNEVLVDFNKLVKKIAGKKNMLGFFDFITVYALQEYVPLTATAVIQQTSETTYRIQSLDPTLSPLVETALKKSEYGFDVKRDFDILTVTIKDQKVFSKDFEHKSLLELLKQHKHRLDLILEKGKVRYAKYPEAIETLKSYQSDIVREMEFYINNRVEQSKA